MNIRMITREKLSRVTRGVLGASVALGVWAAVAAPSVEITKLSRENPDSGVVSCTYTVKDIPSFSKYDLLIKVGAKGCPTSAVITNVNVANGTVTTNVNCKQLLGKNYLNVTVRASLLDGVQLWENGPYFATCNVGASSPEESGYYFWWGDTVGGKRNVADNGWMSVADGSAIVFDDHDPTASQTYNHDITWLKSNGWIGEDGNLVPAHDAATAHLGAPWRMPTKAELENLIDNCDWEWTDDWEGTGNAGCVFRGRGAYASNSVFFPGAGSGFARYFLEDDVTYRTATTESSGSRHVWYLSYASGDEPYVTSDEMRCDGIPVRPVRDSGK